ncbi:hypothetical protein AGDE_09905 [Angomonas deanei]|uniref:Inositol monophosphatase family n=1 Tax=Angomonas deanei TaxID=59799 RepID=A0A7G2CQQ6_9TRYP|nr:hypothetical protein AGDE_09905 [Angomonas deanei]CAD2221815.1 hypothetical protein, conserved [Angomonas deanei]|eukprot:EPY29706.1 hypothetical protein AGDE_09905 [Angomonas deanei]
MGVFLNGRRFSANSKAASVQKSLMFWNAPSFISVPCDNYEEKFNQCIDCWAQLRRTCCQPPFTVSTVRIGNSIMTTLAQLAVGRVDLCVETCCHLAHIVSAILLMEESGGIATDLYGNKIDISKLLSSNEEGSPKMTTLIAGANREVVQFAADLCKKENYGAFWNM